MTNAVLSALRPDELIEIQVRPETGDRRSLVSGIFCQRDGRVLMCGPRIFAETTRGPTMEVTNDAYPPKEQFEVVFPTVLHDEFENTLNLSDRAGQSGGGDNG